MKLGTFFDKFDLFADTPDAVAKIRRLLIQFAVSGKLTPNNPHERPVTLTRFGPPLDNTALPSNWRCGLLGDVFTFEYGDNLPAAKRSQTGEYPVYGSNGIVGTHNTYLTKEPAIIVGRKGSAGALNIATGPSWTTDVAYFVRPPKSLDLRFTYYLFSTLRLDELGKGIKPGLSRKEAYALPIAVPPLPSRSGLSRRRMS
jgi:type I restriction enzyme, S subunit